MGSLTDGVTTGRVVFGGIIASVLAIFLQALLSTLRDPLRGVPGPISARYTNLALKFATLAGERVHWVHALHQKYGPVVRVAPDEISIADAAAFKQIHSVSGGFLKSNWYKELVGGRDVLFVMAEPKQHGDRRRMLAHGFSKSYLRRNWEGPVHGYIKAMIRQMGEEAQRVRKEKGKAAGVDVLKWFTFMSSDVSTRLVFGQDFGAIEKGQVSHYIALITRTVMAGGIGAELPWVRDIGRALPFKFARDFWHCDAQLQDYGDVAVANMKGYGSGGPNIFAKVVAAAAGDDAALDDEDVRCEARSLTIAGTDTTSITLTFLVWAVCKRPELRHGLEVEVAKLPEDFQDADVEPLELLNAVISETLRLYGAAPGALPRIVPEKGLAVQGHFVPAGMTVSTQSFTFHRDPTLFPEPLEFIPERWLQSVSRKQYAVSEEARAVYNPFGMGSHGCIGIHLAQTELRLVVAEFFRTFPGAQVAASTTDESMALENYFLIAPRAHKCELLLPVS